jgi:hypothetical protein
MTSFISLFYPTTFIGFGGNPFIIGGRMKGEQDATVFGFNAICIGKWSKA